MTNPKNNDGYTASNPSRKLHVEQVHVLLLTLPLLQSVEKVKLLNGHWTKY
jgi:hypothetical protein